ncbi:GNAT family N-acetyltransferase [Melittangium boletus]|uniref:Acetyltransferase n=1 Tax=Melittangium boletus DSM 14713 TaxID=1294270 RepID=A0A250IFR1_9BACT|nr:GNAT family N-acetyltransferase [Melittangium boletus]ATB30073.1 acetyltransferase [Melittangium boletus DSM 14713]
MAPVIRPARPEDGPALGRMGAALIQMHHDQDPRRFMAPGDDAESGYRWWLTKELKRAGAVVLVAEREGAVVGYAYGTVEGRDWNALREPHGELHDLWVEASARGGGVGAALAEELVRRLRAQGVPRIMLMAEVGNDSARRLFTRLGWRPTMVEMTRELVPPSEA